MVSKKHSIILATIFSVVVSSCFAQNNTNNSIGNTVNHKDSLPIPNDTFVPLFYEGQLCHWVRNIFQDKSGNLWFGTNHYGVMRYNGVTLEYFDEKDGIGGGRVNGITEDKDGIVWFATYGGITKYDPVAKPGKSFTNYSLISDRIDKDVWSILIDKNGLFWIGTSKGVFQYDGKEYIPFPIPKAAVNDPVPILSLDRITCIIEDNNGHIWFGTDGFGICKFNPESGLKGTGKSFTHFTKEDGLCDNNVADLMEDKDGNIWIGTMYGGICRYNGKSFTNFTKNGVISGDEAYGLYEDKTGNIWFAAENYGVYRYDASLPEGLGQGKSFTNYYTKEGLITNGILSIFEDKERRFWFGGWKGLFRFDGESFFPVTKAGPWSK